MLDVRKSLFPSSKTISQYLGKHESLVLLLLSFKTPAFFNEQDFKSIIFHLHARGNYTSGDFRSGIQSAAYVNEESLACGCPIQTFWCCSFSCPLLLVREDSDWLWELCTSESTHTLLAHSYAPLLSIHLFHSLTDRSTACHWLHGKQHCVYI